MKWQPSKTNKRKQNQEYSDYKSVFFSEMQSYVKLLLWNNKFPYQEKLFLIKLQHPKQNCLCFPHEKFICVNNSIPILTV